jgi:putative PEP-CTERM system TPR-repeat lipoprotein
MDVGKGAEFDAAIATGREQRVRTLIETRKLDEALKEVQALVQAAPSDPNVANLAGAVYLARGDMANARSSFTRAVALRPGYTAAVLNLVQIELKDGHIEAARKRLLNAIAANPHDALAMLGLAYVASAANDEPAFVSWLQKSADANPAFARPRVILAGYYQQKGDLTRALSIARDLLQNHPNDPSVLQLLGTLQLQTGNPFDALATFERWTRAAGNDPAAHYHLALAQRATGNVVAARSEIAKALQLRPGYAAAAQEGVAIELAADRHVEALKIARGLQTADPSSVVGTTLEGDVYLDQKQFPAAVKAYEAAASRAPDDGALAVKLHGTMTEAGNAKAADLRLAQWMKAHPDNPVAHAYLGEVYTRRKQYPLAIEQYEAVVKTHPNAGLLNNLAWLYHLEEDPRALATARKAYDMSPDNPDVLDTLGWIQVTRGEVAPGVSMLQKAVELRPEAAGIRYHLAAALVRAGDRNRARREVERALDGDKPFAARADAEALLRQLAK